MEVETTPTQTPMVIWAPEERSPRPMEAVVEGVWGEARVQCSCVFGVSAGKCSSGGCLIPLCRVVCEADWEGSCRRAEG